MPHTESDRACYYGASLHALRFLEARRPTGRRFGPDADARWSNFQGDLGPGDRVDLLIRDADAQWPGAFGARGAFGLRAVAEDEPFGADWSALDDVSAEALWRAIGRAPAPGSLREALDACAAAWDLRLRWPDPPEVGPGDRLLIAGPSLVAALQVAFSGRADLDWAEQVTVIATSPAHRQLAGLTGAFLNLTKPTRVLAADACAPLSPPPGGRLLASRDASEPDLAALRAIAADGLILVGAA